MAPLGAYRFINAREVLAEISDFGLWIERATRIQTQQRTDKNKLYALLAPEVECIGKCKARKPYEFGVKISVLTIALNAMIALCIALAAVAV